MVGADPSVAGSPSPLGFHILVSIKGLLIESPYNGLKQPAFLTLKGENTKLFKRLTVLNKMEQDKKT